MYNSAFTEKTTFINPETMNRRYQYDKDTDDETLMLLFQAGDHAAFEELYRRHKGPLYRYFLRQCSVVPVAEEMYQDVWLNIVKARSRYETTAKFTTYLYSVARNRLIDYYRRQASGVPLFFDDDPDDPAINQVADSEMRQPDNEFDRKRLRVKLLSLIGRLPVTQREAFLLREEAGLSLEEIAAVTGTNQETAKSRLRYAIAKLREAMKQTGEGV